MISTRGRWRAASAAKRMASTAPIAKFGAWKIAMPASRADASKRARRAASMPVVPSTSGTPLARHALTLDSRRSGRVKSHTTSGCVASSAVSRSPKPSPPAARLGAMRATSSRSPAAATPSATGLPERPVAPDTATRRFTPPAEGSDRPRRRRRRTRPRRGRCRRPRGARAPRAAMRATRSAPA